MVFPFLTTVFAGAESCSGCRRWSGDGLRSPLHFSCRGGGAGACAGAGVGVGVGAFAGASASAGANAGSGDRGGAQ